MHYIKIFTSSLRETLKNGYPKVDKIYFICKITDIELFNQDFPNFHNTQKVQPYWDYYPTKNVIKISIDPDIDEINESTLDIDIPFFQDFGDIFFYVHYTNGMIKTLKLNDFVDFEPEFFVRNKCVSCMAEYNTLQGEKKYHDLTNYFNNYILGDTITPEILLLNYDTLDIPLLDENIKLFTIFENTSKIYSLNEVIDIKK